MVQGNRRLHVAAKTRLTTKQKAFVEAYLANGFNGVKVARMAGYKGNDVTLALVAYEIPQNKALIDERMREMAMSADEALARRRDGISRLVGR